MASPATSARLPKAPGPTADFTRALAVRLAQASGGAQPDPTLAERLDAALFLHHAAPHHSPPAAVPAELAELLVRPTGFGGCQPLRHPAPRSGPPSLPG